jgi:hypothetical protein
MLSRVADPAIAAALAQAIGHPAPFRDEELAAVRCLRLVGAGSLTDVSACTALEELELVGCDVADLAPLSGLSGLRKLYVLACPIVSAAGLVGLDRLEELRLDFAFIEDAAPLFALPSLRRARLLGNPWSEESWQRLSEHCLRAGDGGTAVLPLVELGSSELILDANRRFRAFGLDLCSAKLDAFRTVLVRPGRARVPDEEWDWTAASAADVWLREKGEWTTDSLFDIAREFANQRGKNTAFDTDSYREFGDYHDACRWIDAERDPYRRECLQRFIDRFRGLVFFREDGTFHDEWEQMAGVALPKALREARIILAGALPEHVPEYRLGRFGVSSVRSDALAEGKLWHRPVFEDYGSDEGPTIRDTVRMYPFGWGDGLHSVLAMSLDDESPAIHEYDEWMLFYFLQRGDPPREGVYPVYSSYAEMLGHIVAYRLADGTVIDAADV